MGKDYSDSESRSNPQRDFEAKNQKLDYMEEFHKAVDLCSIEDEYSKELFEAKYAFFKGKLITVYNGHTSDLPGSVGHMQDCRQGRHYSHSREAWYISEGY